MAIVIEDDLPADMRASVDPRTLSLMVDGLNAMATRVAPCLSKGDPGPTPEQLAEARLILVGTLRRWIDAGTGAYSQQSAGPFSVSTDTRQRPGWSLWPSDIERLQAICADGTTGKAFSVDTYPDAGWVQHADVCAQNVGADYCSCGAILAGHPLWEVPC